MKQSILMILVIGIVMILFGCSDNHSTAPELIQSDQFAQQSVLDKKPSPNLIGEAVIDFTFTPPTFWNGTIDFGVYGIYGMTFISHGAPRDYSQASTFYEDFIIYELGNPANVYMRGWESGVVTYANKVPEPVKVTSNGKIEEAYGPLEMWKGCTIHGKGEVIFNDPHNGLPKVAISTIRIN